MKIVLNILNLQKGQDRQKTNNVIDTLIDESGSEITDQNAILTQIGKYYGKLFKSKNIEQQKIDEFQMKLTLKRGLMKNKI